MTPNNTLRLPLNTELCAGLWLELHAALFVGQAAEQVAPIKVILPPDLRQALCPTRITTTLWQARFDEDNPEPASRLHITLAVCNEQGVQTSVPASRGAHFLPYLQRLAELAAVLLDRRVRVASSHTTASWQLALNQLQTDPTVHGATYPARHSTVKAQVAYFPAVTTTATAQMLALTVLVKAVKGTGTGSLRTAGLVGASSAAQKQDITGLLQALRAGEPSAAAIHTPHTLVCMPSTPVQGKSYQLALAVADRMVRGQEFANTGRVIATGAVGGPQGANQAEEPGSASPGQVCNVDGQVEKLALIQRFAQPGDSVLLPLEWKSNSTFTHAPVGQEPAVCVMYVNSVFP